MQDFIKCYILDYHYYLPKERTITESTGREKQIEYLQCLKCGDIYNYPFGEYWHIDRDQKLHNDAHARLQLKDSNMQEDIPFGDLQHITTCSCGKRNTLRFIEGKYRPLIQDNWIFRKEIGWTCGIKSHRQHSTRLVPISIQYR